MTLPIFPSHPQPGRTDLVRYYYRTELHWCSQISEQTTLDVGTALVNAALADVGEANLVFDASLPDGMTPADAVAEAETHFAAQGSRISKWVMNPSAPAERTTQLVSHLATTGFVPHSHEIMHLVGGPAGVIKEVSGLRIIPARASFRHARELGKECAAGRSPQLVEALLLHLEDPHTDALIALADGMAAAFVCVLTVGDLGSITELFVSDRFRRRGIGRTMMSRALEICARSIFKHVVLSVEPQNAAAILLYRQFGFEKIGEFTSYLRRDQTRP